MNHSNYRIDEANKDGMTCWECGNWLIGGGCWKYGQMHEVGWKDTGPNDSCDEWVAYGTEGTITGEMEKHLADEEDCA